jgi:hypothetical protein
MGGLPAKGAIDEDLGRVGLFAGKPAPTGAVYGDQLRILANRLQGRLLQSECHIDDGNNPPHRSLPYK